MIFLIFHKKEHEKMGHTHTTYVSYPSTLAKAKYYFMAKVYFKY